MEYLGVSDSPLTPIIVCLRANCRATLYRWTTLDRHGIWVQHGENSEARRMFTHFEMVNGRLEPIEKWLEELHIYLNTKERV